MSLKIGLYVQFLFGTPLVLTSCAKARRPKSLSTLDDATNKKISPICSDASINIRKIKVCWPPLRWTTVWTNVEKGTGGTKGLKVFFKKAYQETNIDMNLIFWSDERSGTGVEEVYFLNVRKVTWVVSTVRITKKVIQV